MLKRISKKIATLTTAAMVIAAIPMTALAAPGNVDCDKILSMIDKVKPVDLSLNEEENGLLDKMFVEKGRATIISLPEESTENGFEIDQVKIEDENIVEVVDELPEEAKDDKDYDKLKQQIEKDEGAVILWGKENGSVNMDFGITNPSWKAGCTHGHYRDLNVTVETETVPQGTKTARVAEAVREARAAIAAAAQNLLANGTGNQGTPNLTLPTITPSTPGTIQPVPETPVQTPDSSNGGASSTKPSGGSSSGADSNTPSNPSNPSTPSTPSTPDSGDNDSSDGSGGSSGSGSGSTGSGSDDTDEPVYDSPTVLPENPGSGSSGTGGSTGGSTGSGNTGSSGSGSGSTGGSGSGDTGEDETPTYPSPQFLPDLQSFSTTDDEDSTPAKTETTQKSASLSDDNEADETNEADEVDKADKNDEPGELGEADNDLADAGDNAAEPLGNAEDVDEVTANGAVEETPDSVDDQTDATDDSAVVQNNDSQPSVVAETTSPDNIVPDNDVGIDINVEQGDFTTQGVTDDPDEPDAQPEDQNNDPGGVSEDVKVEEKSAGDTSASPQNESKAPESSAKDSNDSSSAPSNAGNADKDSADAAA